MMVKLLLGLAAAPSPHDAADALAVAICHVHNAPQGALQARVEDERAAEKRPKMPRSWRQYRPPANG
jgi:crossover junction endodeoxyribonuclease RuvC